MILTRILAAVCIGLSVLAFFLWIQNGNLDRTVKQLQNWQNDMVTTVRLASGNSKVSKETARAQVQGMGNSLVVMHNAVKTQNEAITKLAAEKAEAEATAKREAAARADAIRTAKQLAKQLGEEALTPVPAQEMEQEIRRVQDLAYEAGL